MSSAWGSAWGLAFGIAWGSLGTVEPPVTPVTQTNAPSFQSSVGVGRSYKKASVQHIYTHYAFTSVVVKARGSAKVKPKAALVLPDYAVNAAAFGRGKVAFQLNHTALTYASASASGRVGFTDEELMMLILDVLDVV